ncbi:unnamed protein product [Prorocentrum cordatum]|uniref:Uncharacterized protein n=1 Tax=Prorocentrum cordatum TaxID=2364126 RepID=A0ABN9WSM0_9DINO|nr:unnamed protein product [Polarella glacialis]
MGWLTTMGAWRPASLCMTHGGCNILMRFVKVAIVLLHGFGASATQTATEDGNAVMKAAWFSTTSPGEEASAWMRYSMNCSTNGGANGLHSVLLPGCAGSAGSCYVSSSTFRRLIINGCEVVVMSAGDFRCDGRQDVVVADCPASAHFGIEEDETFAQAPTPVKAPYEHNARILIGRGVNKTLTTRTVSSTTGSSTTTLTTTTVSSTTRSSTTTLTSTTVSSTTGSSTTTLTSTTVSSTTGVLPRL